MTRRPRVSVKKAAVLTGALALAMGVAACGGGSGGGSSNRALTLILPDTPANIDPCMSTFGSTGRILRENITETLTENNTLQNKLEPKLATSWKQVNPTTWDFTLRKGVTFSDGSPFNAAAVVHDVQRTLSTKLECHNAIQDLATVKSVSAPSTYTFEVKTTAPDPVIPYEFGQVDIASPKTPADKLTNDPVGTGPYELSSYTAQQSVSLKRNPSYWGTKPDADTVKYLFQDSPAVRVSSVQSGQADATVDLPAQFDSVKNAKKFPIEDVAFVWIGQDQAPLNDLRVRQAINYALDRTGIIKSVFAGLGTPATQLVVPAVNGFNPNIKPWTYDPAKAKQLLAAAKADGVPVTKQIDLDMEPGEVGTNGTEFVEAVAGELKAVGLNVKIGNLTEDNHTKYITKPYQEGRAPYLQVHDHGNTVGDSYATFIRYVATNGVESTLTDKGVDKLIAKSTTATGDARTQLLQQVWQKSMVDDAMYAPLVNVYDVGVTSDRVSYEFPPNVQDEIHISDFHFTN
ncbi:MAG: ABC transporter substrate-binding protein [Nocardioides sp.]